MFDIQMIRKASSIGYMDARSSQTKKSEIDNVLDQGIKLSRVPNIENNTIVQFVAVTCKHLNDYLD